MKSAYLTLFLLSLTGGIPEHFGTVQQSS